MSHYDTLGVTRDATPDQMREAYRRKARANHPDRTGGDGAAMAEVNHAMDVLTNPAKREQYDRTGNDGNVATPEAKAQARLMALFDQYLAQEQECTGDLAVVFRQSVEGHIGQMRLQINKAEHRIKRLERERARMKGPEDLFQTLADQRLLSQRQAVAVAKDDVAIDEIVLKLLADWKDVAQPPQQSGMYVMKSATQLGGLGTFFGGSRF